MKTLHQANLKEEKCKKDLGEDANTALHGNLGKEEIISQEPLLEPSELEQPSEEGMGLLQLCKSMHNQPWYSPSIYSSGQVRRQALQRPPNLSKGEDSLRPVPPTEIVITSAATASSIVSTTTIVIPTGSGDEGTVARTTVEGEERNRERG